MGKKKRRKSLLTLGNRIGRLRREGDLSLEELARQTGLSGAYLMDVEEGREMPPVGAILQISRALCVDASSFLKQSEGEEHKRRKKESYEKRRVSYAYKTLARGSPTMHLKAFLVSIDAHQDHDMVEYRHEGEEFIYVVRGELELTVGENQYRLRQGKSVHFNSSIPHVLRNPGAEKTELIVVLYIP